LTALLDAPTAAYVPMTVDELRGHVVAAADADGPIPDDTLVRLVIGVQNDGLRAAAWSLMTREDAPDHFAFWTAAMRGTPDDLLGPVGSLAAFAAWLSGRGVLASHAAERVLQVEPDDPMALSVIRLCAASVNPAVWGPARSGSGVER
jgi:hypothetical protein